MNDAMPKTVAVPSNWTPAQAAEFARRRRGRNYALLAALAGFSLVIYAIAMVKLHEYGGMW